MPGIVDIHGDAFERQLMPRPGVSFAMPIALKDSDRQAVSNGITTVFHGVTASWEPGLRSIDTTRAIRDALEALRPDLAADTRLHLRFEAYNLDAEAEIADWLAGRRVDMLAFNDHMIGPETPPRVRKVSQMAERANVPVEDFAALIERLRARADEVPQTTARLAAAARESGVPMLSHDDMSPEQRGTFRALGCRVAEFPTTIPTAEAATAAGDDVVLGAPNVVRGGSHVGWIDAADMIGRGFCTVLASDYYYPAPLIAAFRLAADGVKPLAEAWAYVAENPARAAALDRPRHAGSRPPRRRDPGRRRRSAASDRGRDHRQRPAGPSDRRQPVELRDWMSSEAPAPRYAIYFVPAAETALYRFGAAVLGYDAYTGDNVPFPATAAPDWPDRIREPRVYGFHATLKPPFRLADGASFADLAAAFDAFATSQSAIDVGPLQVRAIGAFIALMPAAPCPALDELAARLRAPLRPLPRADERRGTRTPPRRAADGTADRQPGTLGLSLRLRRLPLPHDPDRPACRRRPRAGASMADGGIRRPCGRAASRARSPGHRAPGRWRRIPRRPFGPDGRVSRARDYAATVAEGRFFTRSFSGSNTDVRSIERTVIGNCSPKYSTSTLAPTSAAFGGRYARTICWPTDGP